MADRTPHPMSRRRFFGSTIGAGFGAGTLASASIAVEAQTAGVDQNPIRRRGVGLRGIDRARVFDGFTLFAPMGGRDVHLIDVNGAVVHVWHLPYPPGLYGYLTDRGTLFYNGQIPNETFIGKSPFMGGAAMEVDWNGNVLWEVNRADHHHDGRLLKNGNIVLICASELPDDLAKRVRGGRPGTEAPGGRMWSDSVIELTTGGTVVWEWHARDHLDPERDGLTALQDERAEWTHANAVFEQPDGDLLVSFRNISTVVRIDRRSGAIAWKLGAPPLAGQHCPTLLANGHLLLFDNGPHRLDESFPFSRVLEIDPSTRAIVWKYQEARPFNFFSPRISSAQRLPNGNTLVNEGNFGRMFEVTTGGDVVWEYVNPYFGPPAAVAKLQQNSVFRAYRYSEAEVARARTRA
jgi:arylsulfotransferase ASST